MSHGRIVCRHCADVISQCRCPFFAHGAEHTTTYAICDKCQKHPERQRQGELPLIPPPGSGVRT